MVYLLFLFLGGISSFSEALPVQRDGDTAVLMRYKIRSGFRAGKFNQAPSYLAGIEQAQPVFYT